MARLHPLEHCTVPYFNFESEAPKEVKLSDSNAVKLDDGRETQRFRTHDGLNGDLRVDSRRFEVFEINADFEEGKDDDYEYESEEEEEEETVNDCNSDGFYEGVC